MQHQTLTADEQRISEIRERVVGMYTKHPWPGTRRTDEEMGWRLKVLGVQPEDYQGKKVLDMGCGTGEYALWYATHGAAEVTGVDLSEGSLARAREQAADSSVKNVNFVEDNVLALPFADNTFDYSYSVGVLHHTGAPFAGFQEMVRVTKPGGVVVVSLYNSYTRSGLRFRQAICKWIGGDDISKRARWGRRLFPITMWRFNKRYHGLNREEISYDVFGFPHESLHTGHEVLKWFDKTGVDYIGSFAPLRLRDYMFAFSLPEYREFRKTFGGFPLMRFTADCMAAVGKLLGSNAKPPFKRPSVLSTVLCQMAWMPFALRFNCFTLAARKPVRIDAG